MRRAVFLVTATAVGLGAGAGCAQRIGEKATEGALPSFEEQTQAGAAPEERPVETIAGRAVDGAVAHLSDPDTVVAIQRVVAAAASQAARSFTGPATGTVAGALGPDGRGELGSRLAAVAQNAAASATDGALRRVLPECSPEDVRCLDRRIGELSRGAALGFTDGLKRSFGGLALALAFVAGIALTLFVGLVIGLLRARRELRRHLKPAPHAA